MGEDLQKADVWKRVAAWLLDIMLVCVLVVGVGAFLSWALDYDGKMQRYETIYNGYIEQFELQDVDIANPANDAEAERIELADQAMRSDAELYGLRELIRNLMLVIVTFSLFITLLLLEFIVPLLLTNGQTVGKKVFSLGVVRVDGVRVSGFQMFTRAILGKFTIETMVPIYAVIIALFNGMGIAALILLGGLFIGQIVCLSVTKYRCALHDQMSGTVVVDIASQRVFRNSQELIAHTKRIHAAEAARREY